MPVTRCLVVAPFVLTLLLQACTAVPVAQPDAGVAPVTAARAAGSHVAGDDGVPELELNLPQQSDCDYSMAPTADYTFLDKGYRALLDGEYEDAMQHFQRYQRLESSPRASLEAVIAIAYMRMLPRTPFYDPEAARSSFQGLHELNARKLGSRDYTRLMRQSLLNLLELQDMIDRLKTNNATLEADLKKREEALKRLRDLTLNQKVTAQ